MDWLGSATIIVGLVLFVFAITESSHAPRGWSTPYIYATFVLAILILGAAFYVEGWVAEQPLLPFEVFKIKSVHTQSALMVGEYALSFVQIHEALHTGPPIRLRSPRCLPIVRNTIVCSLTHELSFRVLTRPS